MREFKILRDSNNQVLYADFRSALALSEGRMPCSGAAHEALSGRCRALNFGVPLWTPAWTRSIVAYPASGMPFGDYLEYEDVRMTRCVMGTCGFRGERGIALVIDAYTMREDSGRVVIEPAGPIKALEGFPQKDEHSRLFGSDPETALPVISGPGKIALWRNPKASITPAVWAVYGSRTPAAWLRYGISEEFGVLTETTPLSSS